MRNDLKTMASPVNSQIIELGSGDAVVCMEGAIWAATATSTCEFTPIDETPYSGASLITCIKQAYCLANLRRRFASYTVIGSTFASLLEVSKRVHKHRDDGDRVIRKKAFSPGEAPS